MASVTNVNGQRTEFLPMTVSQARREGIVPKRCIVVEKDSQGYNRQVGENEVLARNYIVIPNNEPGARR